MIPETRVMVVDSKQRRNDPSVLPRDSFNKLVNSVVLEIMVTVVITSTMAGSRIKFLLSMGYSLVTLSVRLV